MRMESRLPTTGRKMDFVRTSWRLPCVIPLAVVLSGLVLLLPGVGCGSGKADPQRVVVVYASQDQVYAEPILREFSDQTGIDVRAVYDSEAVKTVGLANRLLMEKSNPQCDIFWNNEELRTRQLAAQSVFREEEPWHALGYRSRRIVINTNLISAENAPKTFSDITNEMWRGKVALAYPMFGTTATHFMALRQHWGADAWTSWCEALEANEPMLVDGNSVVVRLVGAGEVPIGLTDSDDIAAGQQRGLPILALPLTSESLLVPNTVAFIRNAPHPDSANELFEYLHSDEVIERLTQANALEGNSAENIPTQTLRPEWDDILQSLDLATEVLRTIFLRQ